MSAVNQLVPHYSVKDWEQWEGNWELWEGTAVAMRPTPVPKHQRVIRDLLIIFQAAIKAAGCKKCQALSETDWQISHDTVVRPDVVVVCGPLPPKRLEAPPRLVIEVLSASTALHDRTAKRAMYLAARVPYYLIADPKKEKVVGWRLVGDEYETMSVSSPLELTIETSCQISVDFTELFE
jgi:Uma2 family endonuclease